MHACILDLGNSSLIKKKKSTEGKGALLQLWYYKDKKCGQTTISKVKNKLSCLTFKPTRMKSPQSATELTCQQVPSL